MIRNPQSSLLLCSSAPQHPSTSAPSAVLAATLDSGLRRNDGMGFTCLRATHRQAGMTVDRCLTSGARPDATNGLTSVC